MLTLVLVLAVCSWLLLCALLLAVRAPGPSRRPGFVRISPASRTTNRPMVELVRTYTDSKRGGAKQAEEDRRTRLRAMSRVTVLGSSTVGRFDTSDQGGSPGAPDATAA